MLTGLIATFAPYLLIAAAAAGMAYALLYPILTGDVRSEKRRKSLDLAISAMPSIEDPANRSRPSRRDQVAQSLKEIELRKEARGKVTLEIKIMQSGVKIDRKTFYVASLISGIGCGALSFAIFSNAWTIVPGLVVGGLGIPHWYLGIKKSSRIKRFLIELPNALDVITRGLRSGLPLNDCIRMIAAESAEPVRSEFQLVMDAQGVGIPLGDAIEEIYDRIPVAEANYLAIIISIQQKSGGNLSEALSNMAKVVRERRKLANKVQALSAEAKTSAAIIAAMPVGVMLLVYLSTPTYIEILWITQAGQFTLVGCLTWMLMGILIMRKMINFEV